jgi:hypothetical protein
MDTKTPGVTEQAARAALEIVRNHREKDERVTAKAARDALKTITAHVREFEAQVRGRRKRLAKGGAR